MTYGFYRGFMMPLNHQAGTQAVPVFLLVLTIRCVCILFHCLWLVVMTFTEAMTELTGKPRKDGTSMKNSGYMLNLALVELDFFLLRIR